MNSLKYLLLGAVLVMEKFSQIEAAYGLVEPPNRGMVYEKVCPRALDDDWHEYRCGKLWVEDNLLYRTKPVEGEICAACGDLLQDIQPRPFENGGKYGRGLIVRSYAAGSIIKVVVRMRTQKDGYYEFWVCPLQNETMIETEACFDQYKLTNLSGEYQIPRWGDNNLTEMNLHLPQNLTCDHCVLRSQFVTMNKLPCNDGRLSFTCGEQRVYRTCSDVKIQ
ncbi:uncharacterized protein [Venturia canescens]|uniref:uncharacterized protein n=1 Tax=Venturia canescens TaxID=32260 RepID=UPI001C9CF249|nr:uncharacterized protein LOC122417345 [Venturia canescens]